MRSFASVVFVIASLSLCLPHEVQGFSPAPCSRGAALQCGILTHSCADHDTANESSDEWDAVSGSAFRFWERWLRSEVPPSVFSYVWQAKDLKSNVFVSVASK